MTSSCCTQTSCGKPSGTPIYRFVKATSLAINKISRTQVEYVAIIGIDGQSPDSLISIRTRGGKAVRNRKPRPTRRRCSGVCIRAFENTPPCKRYIERGSRRPIWVRNNASHAASVMVRPSGINQITKRSNIDPRSSAQRSNNPS